MEIELKFSLVPDDAAALAQRLAAVPLLSRRKAHHTTLVNTYFDTPDQQLRANRIALRVRQLGTSNAAHWVQTLKTGSADDSALSQRGEWEFALANGKLDAALLQGTPWRDLDPDGALFAALVAQLVIAFTRTTWTVGLRDGSRVEVALDIGSVEAGGTSAPICELELELLAGKPAALFDVARRMAKSVSLMPLHWSKSEQGYQLAQMSLHAPLRACPVALTNAMSLVQVANATLREMYIQFTANLNHLRVSQDPEVLHQARIGWRRFKSALQLFGKHPGLGAQPALVSLLPLVRAMASQRDLDVATFETLPMFANAYTVGDPVRRARWKAMEQALAHATTAQRKVVLDALAQPAVGAALVDTMRWLELDLPGGQSVYPDLRAAHVADWVLRRLERLHEKLKNQPRRSSDVVVQHRIRILSKRLRYGVEALRPLLPKRKAKHWLKEATALQDNIGSARDITRAVDIVQQLQVDAGLVEFLRGVAFGERMHVG